MASVNKVILIGFLGKDPETRFMSNGDAVTNITVATTDVWKDKQGQKQEKTEWHRVTFYRKLAEVVAEFLKKGSPIYIEGRLETKEWEDKEGIKRQTTGIIADKMQMLGSKQGNSEPSERTKTETQSGGFDDFDSDIPFN